FAPEINDTFGLQLDYSFIWPLEVEETSGSHRISLLAKFGETKATKERQEQESLAREAEKQRLKDEKARALAEAARAKQLAEEERLKALAAEEEARKARQAQESAGRAAEEARLRAEVEAAKAAAEAAKAEQDKLALIAEAEKAKLQVKQEDKNVIITLQVNFQTNKSDIQSTERTKLNQVIEILKSFPKYNVRVEGHTDSTGGDEYNLKLSEERAYSVAVYLTGNGISSDRVSYVGYGESRPVADNGTAEGRALNRRVEFVVLTSQQ
ncbi:MAG: OmpA family protein, partial [bacterium]